MKVLNSWAYIDEDQQLHINILAILEMLGKEDTLENRNSATEGALEALKEIVPGVPLFVEDKGEE
jgi:hypothetical protein